MKCGERTNPGSCRESCSPADDAAPVFLLDLLAISRLLTLLTPCYLSTLPRSVLHETTNLEAPTAYAIHHVDGTPNSDQPTSARPHDALRCSWHSQFHHDLHVGALDVSSYTYLSCQSSNLSSQCRYQRRPQRPPASLTQFTSSYIWYLGCRACRSNLTSRWS
jgi:hypothetical protein